MSASIRQEINILDHSVTGTTVEVTANERAQLDTTQYNGTVNYYVEFLYTNTSAIDRNVSVNDGTNGYNFTAVALTLTPTLLRGSISPNAATATYKVILGEAVAGTLTIKSARFVIIQNATTLTNTETQIEIGNYNLARTTESYIALVNPKYWLYTAANWDGTKTFYAEAVYDSGSMDTVSIQIHESSSITAPSWASVATIVSAAETTTPTRTRVAFTPTDGRWYTIFSLNGSMDNHDIYRAGVVVQQVSNMSTESSNTAGSGTSTSSASNDWISQSFTAANSQPLFRVGFWLGYQTAPVTGNIYAKLYAHSGTYGTSSVPTGSPLATSAAFDASALTTTVGEKTFTFDQSFTLVASTNYCIVCDYSAVTDVNNLVTGNDFNTPAHSGNAATSGDGTSWSTVSTYDQRFRVQTVSSNMTKLEPQYLLANTLLAAGTALQTFLTEWDSTEWDDGAGSIAYTFQGETANGSTSDMTLQESDGGGAVTNSTLTNIDNAQISAAMTMPTDQNLDVIANANAGDVAAARILVAYVFAAAAVSTVHGESYEIITS